MKGVEDSLVSTQLYETTDGGLTNLTVVEIVLDLAPAGLMTKEAAMPDNCLEPALRRIVA